MSTIRPCPNCKSTITVNRENYKYTECGLPNVTLVDVETRRCASCGWNGAVIPYVDELHRALAMALIEQKTRLHGHEYRYLRKYLGHSGVDFAGLIGVAPETLSRWENEKEAVPPPADRVIRLMVLFTEPVSEYPEQRAKAVLQGVARDAAPATSILGLRSANDQWVRADIRGGTQVAQA